MELSNYTWVLRSCWMNADGFHLIKIEKMSWVSAIYQNLHLPLFDLKRLCSSSSYSVLLQGNFISG
uniref:Uncharacterized protein n=1 Tax=Rhizophora mucronata TaxID=61149 RepID=A0A2P2R3K0_RHIMU